MKFILGRRELLKGLVPTAILPAVVLPEWNKGQLWSMRPGTYMLFADPQCVDIHDLIAMPHDDVPDDVIVYVTAVKLRNEETIDDVVRLYGLADPKFRTP